MKYDLLILGAGAAGLVAAYQAAYSCPERKIAVIDQGKLPGRKLAAAGNGKCNLTNKVWNEACYHSENREWIREWISNHSPDEVIAFFQRIGILLYENQGYYYPRSNQGKQVSGLLYSCVCDCGVQFAFDTSVISVKAVAGEYEVCTKDSKGSTALWETKHLLLATGGKAYPGLGGSDTGYQLAKALGLSVSPIHPVLSPIYVEDRSFAYAKGVRLDCAVTYKSMDGVLHKEAGQVQFNEKSLSGIVIMNLSSYYNRDKNPLPDSLILDVLPELSWDELKAYIKEQCSAYPKHSIQLLLQRLFPENFVRYIIKRLKLEQVTHIDMLTEKQCNRLVSGMKKLTFSPIAYQDYDKAQATGGGVSLSEVHVNTMESKTLSGLFFAGEILDVDGICGGYNLSFAILSGLTVAHALIDKWNG